MKKKTNPTRENSIPDIGGPVLVPLWVEEYASQPKRDSELALPVTIQVVGKTPQQQLEDYEGILTKLIEGPEIEPELGNIEYGATRLREAASEQLAFALQEEEYNSAALLNLQEEEDNAAALLLQAREQAQDVGVPNEIINRRRPRF